MVINYLVKETFVSIFCVILISKTTKIYNYVHSFFNFLFLNEGSKKANRFFPDISD